MMLLVLIILFMPFCAALSGFLVWAINRDNELEDNDLFKSFLFILIACMLIFFGIGKTNAVRMKIDPPFRMQTELNTHPVYLALKEFAPDDFKQLDSYLSQQMSQGATLNEAFLQARSLLTKLGNERLGFADQKTRVLWGGVMLDSLKALQASDPSLCYLAISSKPLDQVTLAQTFSAENTKLFQQAVTELYASANRTMRHEYPADEKSVEFNAAALEFRTIQSLIEQQFGKAAANQIAKKNFPEPPAEPKDIICAARIFQLEAMLERPKAMAAMLIDSVLR